MLPDMSTINILVPNLPQFSCAYVKTCMHRHTHFFHKETFATIIGLMDIMPGSVKCFIFFISFILNDSLRKILLFSR